MTRYYLVSVHECDDEGVEIGAVDIDHALSTDGMRDVTVTEVQQFWGEDVGDVWGVA